MKCLDFEMYQLENRRPGLAFDKQAFYVLLLYKVNLREEAGYFFPWPLCTHPFSQSVTKPGKFGGPCTVSQETQNWGAGF